MSRLSPYVLALAGCLASPSAALCADSDLSVAYSISFWGIPFGHTDFDTKFAADGYATRSHFETSGIVSVFWQATIDASSGGHLAQGGLEPAFYDSFYQRGADKKERVKVTYTKSAAPEVVADPPYPTNTNPVTDEQKKEALDPLSAVTLVLAGIHADTSNPCGTVAPVFDGRRRYNIAFRYLKDEKPDEQILQFKGPVHLCQMHYNQIAGFKPKILKEGKAFPPIYGWFADVRDAGSPGGRYVVALKIWASTGWGTVAAHLDTLHTGAGVQKG